MARRLIYFVALLFKCTRIPCLLRINIPCFARHVCSDDVAVQDGGSCGDEHILLRSASDRFGDLLCALPLLDRYKYLSISGADERPAASKDRAVLQTGVTLRKNGTRVAAPPTLFDRTGMPLPREKAVYSRFMRSYFKQYLGDSPDSGIVAENRSPVYCCMDETALQSTYHGAKSRGGSLNFLRPNGPMHAV